MLIRTHVGLSLDGFLATPDGFPAWEALPAFDPERYGVAELAEQCDAIVMGRTSFDQGFEHWLADWPYKGTRVYVLTSSPLPERAPEMGVIASSGGPAGLVEQLREANLAKDAHVLGGSRIIQAFLELGAIDRLGIVIIPVLLGKGIPLFPIEPVPFSDDAWATALESGPAGDSRPLLRLERHRELPDGAMELVYARA